MDTSSSTRSFDTTLAKRAERVEVDPVKDGKVTKTFGFCGVLIVPLYMHTRQVSGRHVTLYLSVRVESEHWKWKYSWSPISHPIP